MTFGRLFAVTLTVLLASCAAASAGTPPTSPSPEPPAAVTFEQLTPGVWLHLSTLEIKPWGEVPAYGLVVLRGEESLLVDTAWTDAQTEEIVRWASDTLGAPITAAVFTHAHQDKMGGVGALRARGIATYAAADSNALAEAHGLVPAEHTLTFDDDASSSELPPAVVFDPGAGHTVDNIVVALPDAGVLFGGCLVRPLDATDLGNTTEADLDHWDEAVERVAARFPHLPIIVPSHGPPAGRELLELTVRLVHEAAAAAQ